MNQFKNNGTRIDLKGEDNSFYEWLLLEKGIDSEKVTTLSKVELDDLYKSWSQMSIGPHSAEPVYVNGAHPIFLWFDDKVGKDNIDSFSNWLQSNTSLTTDTLHELDEHRRNKLVLDWKNSKLAAANSFDSVPTEQELADSPLQIKIEKTGLLAYKVLVEKYGKQEELQVFVRNGSLCVTYINGKVDQFEIIANEDGGFGDYIKLKRKDGALANMAWKYTEFMYLVPNLSYLQHDKYDEKNNVLAHRLEVGDKTLVMKIKFKDIHPLDLTITVH